MSEFVSFVVLSHKVEFSVCTFADMHLWHLVSLKSNISLCLIAVLELRLNMVTDVGVKGQGVVDTEAETFCLLSWDAGGIAQPQRYLKPTFRMNFLFARHALLAPSKSKLVS